MPNINEQNYFVFDDNSMINLYLLFHIQNYNFNVVARIRKYFAQNFGAARLRYQFNVKWSQLNITAVMQCCDPVESRLLGRVGYEVSIMLAGGDAAGVAGVQNLKYMMTYKLSLYIKSILI